MVLRRVIELKRNTKRIIVLLFDILLVSLCFQLSLVLRLGEVYLPNSDTLWLFFLSPVIAILSFWHFGLYRVIIRFINFKFLWPVTYATVFYGLLLGLIILLVGIPGFPRSVIFINIVLINLFVFISRVLANRIFSPSQDQYFYQNNKNLRRKNVIIYGAGSAGAQLTSALNYSANNDFKPIAFIDDDISLRNHEINGLKIYSLNSINKLIENYQADEIILAIPSSTKSRRKEIITLLEPYQIKVRTLPDLSDIAKGKVKVESLREVGPEDLLGRDSVTPHKELLKNNIENKSIMITGAGGSIGSELVRKIILLNPKIVILYELNEHALYQINMDSNDIIHEREITNIKVVRILGDVKNISQLINTMKKYKVDTVYHTAAYKHVPLVEENIIEAIVNNSLGTYYCAEAAIETEVENFVLISTDKAVRPTNVMGATKRLAEMILQSISEKEKNEQSKQITNFCMVRFGNVIGSSGSVIPLFKKQIKKGGPITITDPRIIRYFMTISEASELVIQAGALSNGGEVFLLDMGEPVKILSLAKKMVRLSGLTVNDENNKNGDISIKFTGLRPGEKLYEELLITGKDMPTDHPQIMKAEEKFLKWDEMKKIIDQIKNYCDESNEREIIKLLSQNVTGFMYQGNSSNS